MNSYTEQPLLVDTSLSNEQFTSSKNRFVKLCNDTVSQRSPFGLYDYVYDSFVQKHTHFYIEIEGLLFEKTRT